MNLLRTGTSSAKRRNLTAADAALAAAAMVETADVEQCGKAFEGIFSAIAFAMPAKTHRLLKVALRGDQSNVIALLKALSAAEQAYIQMEFYDNKDGQTFSTTQLSVYTELDRLSKMSLIPVCERACRVVKIMVTARKEMYKQYLRTRTPCLNDDDYPEIIQSVEANIAAHEQATLADAWSAPYAKVLNAEAKTFLAILHAEQTLLQYAFQLCSCHLAQAQDALAAWHELSLNEELLATHPLPTLLSFMSLWIASIQARVSLYFRNILNQFMSRLPADAKVDRSMVESDLFQKIRTYHRKSDATAVCLVYEVRPGDEFHAEGYAFPGTEYTPLTGLNSFPCLTAFPGDKPVEHWANVVSLIMDNYRYLDVNRTVSFYDNAKHASYALRRIDARVVMVCILTGKRGDNDQVTLEFIKDVVHVLCRPLKHPTSK